MGAAGDAQGEGTICKCTAEYSPGNGARAPGSFHWRQSLRSKAAILALNLSAQHWRTRECPSKLGSDMTLFLYQKNTNKIK